MIDKVARLAEQVVSGPGISRRKFFGWVGQRAVVAAGVLGALLTAPKTARAGGGDCYSTDDCADFEYCAKDYGDCGGLGTCTHKPDICPDDCFEACACDGQIYCNDCFAALAGTTLTDC